jgi:hypothetical protein
MSCYLLTLTAHCIYFVPDADITSEWLSWWDEATEILV